MRSDALSAESCIRKAVLERGLTPGLVGLADTKPEDEAATGTAFAFVRCNLNRWARGVSWEESRATAKGIKGGQAHPRTGPSRGIARRMALVRAERMRGRGSEPLRTTAHERDRRLTHRGAV